MSLVWEARSMRSRYWQNWFLSRALQEGPILGLSTWLLFILSAPICVYLCVLIFTFYKNINHIGLELTLLTSVIIFIMTLPPNKVIFWDRGSVGLRTLHMNFERIQFSLQQVLKSSRKKKIYICIYIYNWSHRRI